MFKITNSKLSNTPINLDFRCFTSNLRNNWACHETSGKYSRVLYTSFHQWGMWLNYPLLIDWVNRCGVCRTPVLSMTTHRRSHTGLLNTGQRTNCGLCGLTLWNTHYTGWMCCVSRSLCSANRSHCAWGICRRCWT